MADTAIPTAVNPTVPLKSEDKKPDKTPEKEYKVLKPFNTGAGEDGEKTEGDKLKESESNPTQISYLLADKYIEE